MKNQYIYIYSQPNTCVEPPKCRFWGGTIYIYIIYIYISYEILNICIYVYNIYIYHSEMGSSNVDHFALSLVHCVTQKISMITMTTINFDFFLYPRLPFSIINSNILYWLVVWTPLKNISQLGWLFPIYGKIKTVPNHQPVIHCLSNGGFCINVATPIVWFSWFQGKSHRSKWMINGGLPPFISPMLIGCSITNHLFWGYP